MILAESPRTKLRSSGMYFVFPRQGISRPENVASTPAMPPRHVRPQHHHHASLLPLPPQCPKKRSSDEANSDSINIKIQLPKLQPNRPTTHPPNTPLTPNYRPIKKPKLFHKPQTPTPIFAAPVKPPQNPPHHSQNSPISATQLHILQHLPPSQLLMDAATFSNLHTRKPLLTPLARHCVGRGRKRTWGDAVGEDGWGWGVGDLGGVRRKRAMVEVGWVVGG